MSNLLDGWYVTTGNTTRGPLSGRELRDLLDSGQLQPHQAVWQRRGSGSVYVRAETAASNIPAAGSSWKTAP